MKTELLFDAFGSHARRFIAGLPLITLDEAKADAKARRDAKARSMAKRGQVFTLSDDDASGRYGIHAPSQPRQET